MGREFKIFMILITTLIALPVITYIRIDNKVIYRDNNIKACVIEDNLIMKNNNKEDVNITILSNDRKIDSVINSKSVIEDIKLMQGVNKIFLSCKDFEDTFEVTIGNVVDNSEK